MKKSIQWIDFSENDYLVPVAHAHRDVLVKGYVDVVAISVGAEEIARHPRSYDNADFVFDPLHYLALLERKIGALDQAALLQGWALPDAFPMLRRLLEARLSGKNRCAAGEREYVQALRLLETFPMAVVHGAVVDALKLGAIGYDAVKHLALCRVERRPPKLSLEAYPYLPEAIVESTSAASYMSLLAGDGAGAPKILLRHHLKRLKLPTVLREYEKLARQCAAENVDHVRYLTRLIELELLDREARTVERRIRDARFPAVKSLESFDFDAIPGLNKKLVLDPARCEFVARRENVIALGPSGTGKTHAMIGLGLAACQRGVKTRFATAAAIVNELIEARDEKRLLRLQKTLSTYEPLIIDELGFVPLSRTRAELLFELISQRYERGATIITSNLPFDEWTATFGDERLTGALLDRLTHHVHILEMNGPSYRLAQSRARRQDC